MVGSGIEWDIIQYVWQLELPNVPLEGWIIDPDEHGFLIVLVILCASLPTMETLSTLM